MQLLPLTLAHLDAPIWDSTEEYERMLPRLLWHLHTPYARSWCALQHDEVVGMGAALRFGDQVRITVCKCVTGRDAKAIRTALVEHMLRELKPAGCMGFTVTVAPDEVSAWEALGFVAQEPLLRYSGGRFLEPTSSDMEWIAPQHRLAVMHMDRRASGQDRHTLLLEHEYLGLVHVVKGRVRGFALALLGNALIVSDAPHVGLELQRNILIGQPCLLVPEGNATAHEHLLERGYAAATHGVRMTHGAVPEQRSAHIYGEPYGAL